MNEQERKQSREGRREISISRYEPSIDLAHWQCLKCGLHLSGTQGYSECPCGQMYLMEMQDREPHLYQVLDTRDAKRLMTQGGVPVKLGIDKKPE